MKTSVNELAAYARRIDACPLSSDLFGITLTRAQLHWLRRIAVSQVLTERRQLEHYIRRDADKHPERNTIDKFKRRLEVAKAFVAAIDNAKKE